MLPPGWDASPSQGYPQHYAGTHLFTWVERGTVGVKRLAEERNTMSPARPRTRTTRSGVERTNHEATAPPTPKMGSSNHAALAELACVFDTGKGPILLTNLAFNSLDADVDEPMIFSSNTLKSIGMSSYKVQLSRQNKKQ